MRIALLGYGRMGREVETAALGRGHTIVLRIDETNRHERTPSALGSADVAIEFSGPAAAEENVRFCLDHTLPVVSGSTGWDATLTATKAHCIAVGGAMLHATNFSIGVNIFFEINRRLAGLLSPYPDYRAGITEIHHTAKKDAPSGTAITLAEGILAAQPRYAGWALEDGQATSALPIESIRQDPAPGTHRVHYLSPIDDIEIIHTAHNRKGFALGAVLAAEVLMGKQGVFSMQDVLAMA